MFGFLRRRPKIAPARALKLGAHRAPPARRVSTIVSLGVRVSTVNAQLAWLLVAAGALVATYFVSKIDLHPKPQLQLAADTAKATGFLVRPGDIRSLERALDLLETKPRAQIQETYGTEAFGAIAIPGVALVVALLLSMQRRKRRLLRHGREVKAEIREFDTTGESARGSTVELWLPVEGTTIHKGIITIRPPDAIGGTESVLYDPHTPTYAFAVADLPGRPRIVDNRLVPTRFSLAFLAPLTALGLLGVLAGTIARVLA